MYMGGMNLCQKRSVLSWFTAPNEKLVLVDIEFEFTRYEKKRR